MIKGVLNEFWSEKIGHTKREANFVAHELAKATTKQVRNNVWMEEILMCICDMVTLEQHALSS
jgi:hypothetical protein